ncbi:MAG: hypothetical protein AB7E79_05580 [Rhodospirillaceae bacterium]
MGWRRVEFGEDALARKLPEALKETFARAFEAAGAPGNAALFEHREGNRIQYYFSPGASALLESTLSTLGPKRAGAPPAGARLLVGNAETWKKQ